jgi:TonB family protein
MGELRCCTTSASTGAAWRALNLAGKVAISFIVSPEGTVKQSRVAQSMVGNAEFEACVAGQSRRWLFPKSRGGGMVRVTYVF